MPQDHVISALSDARATVVLVIPAMQAEDASRADIAGALRSAARVLGNRRGPSGALPAGLVDEASLMRRVEAEIYAAD